jgi:hypothetical protein
VAKARSTVEKLNLRKVFSPKGNLNGILWYQGQKDNLLFNKDDLLFNYERATM